MNRMGLEIAAAYLELKPNYIASFNEYERKCKRRRAFKQSLIIIAVSGLCVALMLGISHWKKRELVEAINDNYDVYIRGEEVEIASEDDIRKMDAYVYRIEHDSKCIYLRYND